MAVSARELEQDPFIKVLLMGPPKHGKTTMAIASAPKPVRVFLCEGDSALKNAIRVTGPTFSLERTRTHKDMLEAIYNFRKEQRRRKKDGKKLIRTLVVDPFSSMARRLEAFCLKETRTSTGADNGLKAYPMYGRILHQITEQLIDLKCHVIVITHYFEEDKEDGEVERIPLLAGKAAKQLTADFPDIVWFENDNGKRVIVTGSGGAYSPGCRSLKDAREFPADVMKKTKKPVGIRALIKAFRQDSPFRKSA